MWDARSAQKLQIILLKAKGEGGGGVEITLLSPELSGGFDKAQRAGITSDMPFQKR